jgi:hypothetical protein
VVYAETARYTPRAPPRRPCGHLTDSYDFCTASGAWPAALHGALSATRGAATGPCSTSVKGETGNGGNIAIDPQLVILDHSSIIAQAVEGHGGNITITAGQFIPSSDSIVSASSELGISGTIVINGPRVDVNGALAVLSTQLRSRTEVLREACATRAGQPISSLVESGRGGLPQDPEATLPALYIAGRDVTPSPPSAAGPTEASGALQTTVHLTMRCG